MKQRIRSRIVVASLQTFVVAAVVGIKLSVLSSTTGKAVQTPPAEENRLIVHEWGTFTSIAGKDGVALEWRPLNGPNDLPKFVYTIEHSGSGASPPRQARVERGSEDGDSSALLLFG